MRWALNSASRLHIYDPGEDTVICFNATSGDTHLLTRLAAATLGLLQEDGITVRYLTQNLQLDPETPDTEIAKILQELQGLGLVSRID